MIEKDGKRILAPPIKRKKVLKSTIDGKMQLVNFLIHEKDLARIKAAAEEYCDGNVSAWIRYCCLNYRPSEDELVEVDCS